MKKLITLLLLMSLPLLMGSTSYNYSFYGDVIYSVPGMTFVQYFNEHTLGTSFITPSYFVIHDEKIYLIDSGNHSLYIIGSDYSLLEGPVNTFSIHPDSQDKDIFEEITEITLSSPQGLDVTQEYIYIADTNNNRIVKMTHDYLVIDIFKDPADPVFKDPKLIKENEERRKEHEESQEDLPEDERTVYKDMEIEGIDFKPSKITVDNTNRMYVIQSDVYEGIIEFSEEGEFNRYTGVNPLKLSAFEVFRRSLMSEAQLKKLKTYLPTSYTSVTMGDGSFIYATSQSSENNAENMIQLINPKGVDVIRRNGYVPPMGDFHYIDETNNYVSEGPSQLVDIDYTRGGIYSVLDRKRSRVFTYDSEGNLLYISGSEGDQSDKFRSGVSLGYLGSNLIVLNQNEKTFVVYGLSNFGKLVNEAVYLEYIGDYAASRDVWEEVVRLNANYEIGYNGIGRYYLREGQYKTAIEYFKLGHDSYYYSKAYQNYRNDLIRKNFGWIFGGIVLITGGLIARSVYKKRKGGAIDDEE